MTALRLDDAPALEPASHGTTPADMVFIPGGTFHTARITGKRRWFLGASTEWPGVVPEEDVELGDADQLARKYPEAAADIRTFPVPAEK